MWFRKAWLQHGLIHKTAAGGPGRSPYRAVNWLVAAALTIGPTAVTLADGDVIPAVGTDEGSVLVANRAADDGGPSAPNQGSEDLEPTSEIAEHTPDLAEVETPTKGWQSRSQQPQNQPAGAVKASPSKSAPQGEASQFGAALAEVVRSRKSTPAAAPSKAAARQESPATLAERVPYEPAKFNGIQPGKSTREELQAAWGQPVDSVDTSEGTVLTYETEPFEAVDVLILPDGLVAALKITLRNGIEPDQLAGQLALEAIESVTIADENNRPLGLTFPERGVVFMYDGTSESAATDVESSHIVIQVAIQALDARAFALRAENQLHGPYSQNIDDLKTAISIDPGFSHARWLLAEIYLATGQADLAEAEATAALEQESTNAAYQLRHGQSLILLGRYDDAVHEVRGVLDRADASPVVRAQAMYEMARLASMGDAEIAAKTISFHTRAIELADKLATSENAKERRAAKRLLVDAHLAIAEEIARQSFGDKVESLSQWIGRASGLAEDCIASEGASDELRLIVAQRALAALASFKPTLDPAPWVAEGEEAAAALKKQSEDELWQQKVAWELGQLYLHALRTEHLRRETTAALRYGQLAIENLAEGAKSRQAVHSAEQQVGQLYFHVGAVYAVHQQDHKKAVAWYDKAAPLLNGKRPSSELYSPRRDGEMLVSIGVSYWQTGNHAKALEMTEAGSKLVEAAVEDGILAKSSLAVPYGNLATMYQQVGENANATKYANLAKAATGGDANKAPRTGRTTPAPSGRTGMMIQTGAQQNRPAATRR
jgi:Tfp pilus assembly protein PilF